MHQYPRKPPETLYQSPPVTYHSRPPQDHIPPTPEALAEAFEAGRPLTGNPEASPDVVEALEALWQLIALQQPEELRRNSRHAAAYGAANPRLADPDGRGLSLFLLGLTGPQADPENPALVLEAEAYRRCLTLLFQDAPTAFQPGPRDPATGAITYRRISRALAAFENHLNDYTRSELEASSHQQPDPGRLRWTADPSHNREALVRISSDRTDPGAVLAHASALVASPQASAETSLEQVALLKHDGDIGLLHHTAVNAAFQAQAEHRLLRAALSGLSLQGSNTLVWESVYRALIRIDFITGLQAHATDRLISLINLREHEPLSRPRHPSLLHRLLGRH